MTFEWYEDTMVLCFHLNILFSTTSKKEHFDESDFHHCLVIFECAILKVT